MARRNGSHRFGMSGGLTCCKTSTLQAAYRTQVDAFLQCKHVAVLGYSRSQKLSTANAIYDKLRANGYTVYPVNPFPEHFPGMKVFSSVEHIPYPLDAAMICTPPDQTLNALKACGQRGIRQVWIHRSVDGGSYAPGVEAEAAKWGMSLLTFGCPMMFIQPDVAHRCMKWVFNIQGKFSIG